MARFTSVQIERGIHLSTTQQEGKAQNLVDLLCRDQHIGLSHSLSFPHERLYYRRKTKELPRNSNRRIPDMRPDEEEIRDEVLNKIEKQCVRQQPEGVPPDDHDSDDDDDGREPNNNRERYQLFQPRKRSQVREELEGHRGDKRGMGMTWLMKTYHGKQSFTVGWDEDLDN